MSTVQHYLRVGESLQSLEDSYGVAWQNIADATFGGHTTQIIYDYLSTHGGKKWGAYPNHHTGYHWGFETGMVAEIPGVTSSLSPVPAGATTWAAGGAVEDVPEWSGGNDQVYGPSSSSGSAPVVHASTGGGGMWMVILGILMVGMAMSGGKKKPVRRRAKPRARRKPARRRR